MKPEFQCRHATQRDECYVKKNHKEGKSSPIQDANGLCAPATIDASGNCRRFPQPAEPAYGHFELRKTNDRGAGTAAPSVEIVPLHSLHVEQLMAILTLISIRCSVGRLGRRRRPFVQRRPSKCSQPQYRNCDERSRCRHQDMHPDMRFPCLAQTGCRRMICCSRMSRNTGRASCMSRRNRRHPIGRARMARANSFRNGQM